MRSHDVGQDPGQEDADDSRNPVGGVVVKGEPTKTDQDDEQGPHGFCVGSGLTGGCHVWVSYQEWKRKAGCKNDQRKEHDGKTKTCSDRQTMQRRVAGLLAVVMAGIMSVEQTNFASAQPTCVTFPSPDMCNWGHEFTTARDTLGQEDAWSIEYLDDDYALTNMDTGKVRFSPSIPCQLVGPVARHEYMHQLQGEFYGGDERVDEAYHDEASIEEVADCGARLIDPTNVPYAWGTCDSGSVRDNARMLIDFNGG